MRTLDWPIFDSSSFAACHNPERQSFRGTNRLSFRAAAWEPLASGSELTGAVTNNAAGTPKTAALDQQPAALRSTPRTVQETDIYAVDGNRLYALSAYRGLLVFDITNPDAPALLGRSQIFGTPEEMTVNAGVAEHRGQRLVW